MEYIIIIALVIIILLLLILLIVHFKKREDPQIIQQPDENAQRLQREQIRNLFRHDLFRDFPLAFAFEEEEEFEPEKTDLDKEYHDDDPQNSHDSVVVASLNKKYKKLIDLYDWSTFDEAEKNNLKPSEIQTSINLETIKEVRSACDKYVNNMDKKLKINKVLNTISEENTLTSFDFHVKEYKDKIKVTDSWILYLIWQRIHHADNLKNQELLEQALIDQLYDCYENNDPMVGLFLVALVGENKGHVVCVNGRVARIISSLSLLDNDPILAEPEKDIAEITNMAYSKASQILKSTLEKNKAAELYSKSREKMSTEEKTTIDKIENDVKNNIKQTLTSEYQGFVPTKVLDNIILTAQEAI